MKNNNQIGQELSEFKPVELVGCENEEAGNPDALASRVVHSWSGKYFGILPVDLDESRERITGDWSYEYAIFELVRLYKVFDWENDDLVLEGW